MITCPNCGAEEPEGKKFCRHCGIRLVNTGEPSGEETTLHLPATTMPSAGQPTSQVGQATTGEPVQPTGPYIPPINYYAPPAPIYYPVQSPPLGGRPRISLGEWLSRGWRIYSENWAVMTFGTLFAFGLSALTAGILAGPTLMGLFRMAFRTMRGETPEMGDLFKWEGRFIHAFVAFLAFAAIYGGLSGTTDGGLQTLLSFIVLPVLSISLGLALPLMTERKMDVVAAINESGRLIFSRDAFMWWLVGLVFTTISTLGIFGCFVGVFVTFPWMVCSAAEAYRSIFGLDDPNRTLP